MNLRWWFLLLLPLTLTSVWIIPHTSSSNQGQLTPDYWPTDDWRVSIPEAQGMSSVVLQQLHDFIRSQSLPLDSYIVVRHGYIVYEDYPSSYGIDTLHILHSVTKSFTSALIGIAIEEGYISNVEESVVSFFSDRTIANLDDRKQRMTVRHLLNMQAGLQWNEWTFPYSDMRNDLRQMVFSPDCIQFVLDRLMTNEPGTLWIYNTGASHLLAGIIHETTGQIPLAFAFDHLFGPLGITRAFWTLDRNGLNYGGSELHLRPRDMAKFGLLYLNDGEWDGTQIVPAEWVDQSQLSEAQPFVGVGYGHQWWKQQSMGTFEGRGLYNQWIIVHPEYDLVIVQTASDFDGEIDVFGLVQDYVFRAIEEFSPVNAYSLTLGLFISLMVVVPVVIVGTYFYRKRAVPST
ncbi:MAG: serine hydrolase domain-containing protein [Candidatus Hermodarchaeia archaeon]